jgi:type II secretory pathway component GspD/PulD (secretin)
MSRTNAGRLGIALLLVLGLGLAGTLGQEKGSGKSDRPAEAAKSKRIVHVVKYGTAKDVAAILGKHFKGEVEVQVLPESPANCLLINAPAAVFGEVVQLLAQMDRHPQTIAVEVLVAQVSPKKGKEGKPEAEEKGLDLKEFSGPAADVRARLRALQGKGQIDTLRRFQLTVVEGLSSSVLAGKNQPSVVAVNRLARGPVARSITYRQVGTQVRVTARVGAEKQIQIDLDVNDARMVPDDNIVLGKDENGAPIPAMDHVIARFTSKLSVAPGQAVAAQGVKTTSRSGKEQTLVVVTARVVDPNAKPEKADERPRRPRQRPRPFRE